MNGAITVLGCMNCRRCDSACDNGALSRIDGIARIDYNRCTQCMRCVIACPNKALRFLEV